jgi:hypothetical protein
MAVLDPWSRVNRLREFLPILLSTWENVGVRDVRPQGGRGDHWQQLVDDRGIAHLFQSGGTDRPGSINFTIELPIERSGGWVPDSGAALADWIGRDLEENRTQRPDRAQRCNPPSERRHTEDAPFHLPHRVASVSPMLSPGDARRCRMDLRIGPPDARCSDRSPAGVGRSGHNGVTNAAVGAITA